MKIIKIKTILLLALHLLIGCADEPKNNEGTNNKKATINKAVNQVEENLNISFLLDLSDRISPDKYPNESMEFYLRDVGYIKSVSEAFTMHLQKKRVRQMDDKIQVFFDPEPQNQNINEISRDLKFHITRNNASIELIEEIKKVYASRTEEIYQLAIEDGNYVGSDTWRYFKNNIKAFCIEENYRNILILLTDGYIFHKDRKIKEGNKTTYITPEYIRTWKLNSKNWKDKFNSDGYGFIPATDSLQNLEILVLGINPSVKNPYEEDVILKYWSDWFDTMNVSRYEIKSAELPSNMDKIIKDFILNK